MKDIHNPLEGPRPTLTVDLNDGSEERISIIVPSYRTIEYTNLFLQSLTIASINNNYEIIVVQNGAKKADVKEKAFLDQIEEDGIKVVRNEENLYWTKAINQGYKVADKDSKYFLFCHNDITITSPHFLDICLNCMESNNVGVLGLVQETYGLQGGQKVTFPSDCCFFTKREVIEDCKIWDGNAFDEDLPQVGSQFLFIQTVNKRGYNIQILATQGLIYHWRALSMDINVLEQMVGQSTSILAQKLTKLNSV